MKFEDLPSDLQETFNGLLEGRARWLRHRLELFTMAVFKAGHDLAESARLEQYKGMPESLARELEEAGEEKKP